MTHTNTCFHAVRKLLALLTFLLVVGFGREALANSYTFCVQMDTDLENVNFGEDYYLQATGPYAGRYIKVKVTRGAVVLVNTTYANGSGCVSFTDNTTGQFKLEVWSEMKVPRTDNTGNTNTVRILNSAGNQVYWNYFWTFGGTTGSKTFTLAQSNRTNLIAVARWAFERYSDGLINKITEIHDFASDTCPDNSCNDTYGGSTATVYINPIHNKRKFLIGHEIGHAFIAHWFGYNPYPATLPGQGTLYSRNEGGASCEWAGAGAHAIHSKGYSSGALLEAFPHHYATYVFNSVADYGGFWYYKDGTGVTEVDMESGPTGGVSEYLETTCTGSDVARGVELDWARQFWDFRTNPGTLPSNYALARQIKNGLTGADWDMEDGWQKMQDGIEEYDTANGTAFESRWNVLGPFNGVDH